VQTQTAAAPITAAREFCEEVNAMAQVYLPTPLRRLTHGQAKIAASGRTVDEALTALEHQYPGLREQLREPTGEVRSFINVFVNGAEIRTLQGPSTPLRDGDEVSIIPAMAGGRT
jgi:molybdopterin synthase sulfur carrier subunit